MTQTKQEKVITSLKEKIGEKLFNRTQIIADQRFGNKDGLKTKFYQSIIEGYIQPNDLWTNDETIENLKVKIESTPEEEKEKLILEIIETYDVSDPKIKSLLRKYERYFAKFLKIKPN